jgi:glucosamine kinase
MILVADSGSTKTQWGAIFPDGIEKLQNTPGINPILLSLDEIEGIIRPILAEVIEFEVDTIYFYGAGCSSINSKEKIGKALFSIFHSSNIIVDSDLLAACLALAGNEPAIIGLLGTGSNSCFWNGTEIEFKVPSLGYILGDEGGGVSIGKQLVSDFLKNQMPLNLRLKFIEKYNVSTEIVLERVYQMQMPNRYLAGFAPFVENNIDDPYCRNLLDEQFDCFLKRNILQYENVKEFNLQFCGSIAFAYRDELLMACERYNLKVDKIVKEPLDGLAHYLKENIYIL